MSEQAVLYHHMAIEDKPTFLLKKNNKTNDSEV